MVFRQALGSFASGVVVVTALTADGEPHGMTANGFVSVSLDPPLVLVSVGERAHTHQLLTEGDRYGVSILGRDQTDVAKHFAGKPQEGVPDFEAWQGVPIVPGSIGALSCTIVDRHIAGDHTLFIGRVDALEHSGGAPLTFHAGQFGELQKGE